MRLDLAILGLEGIRATVWSHFSSELWGLETPESKKTNPSQGLDSKLSACSTAHCWAQAKGWQLACMESQPCPLPTVEVRLRDLLAARFCLGCAGDGCLSPSSVQIPYLTWKALDSLKTT